MKQTIMYIRYILFLIAAGFYGVAIIDNNYNYLLLATLIVLLQNLLYACEAFKERAFFAFLNITFFVFLLGRPVIYLFRGVDWVAHVVNNYSSSANVWLGVELMLLSLVCIWIGGVFGTLICGKVTFSSKDAKYYSSSFLVHHLRWISRTLFLVSLLINMILGIEQVQYIVKYSYAESFLNFQSQVPYIFYIISTFLPYSLCLYLATFPEKSKAYIILSLYVFSTIPTLLVGERNPFVLSVLFSMLYFIFRDYMGDSKKWFGKFEKIALIVAAPLGLALLGMLNYTRDNISVGFNGIGDIIMDLIVKQGVSFSWLCSGLGVLNDLPSQAGINYTFGGIIDYFKYGSIAKVFLGVPGLGSGNSIQKATEGNSMAHHLSNILLGERYLQGHGCGSSYILEVYADYGYIGIVICNIILGIFLIMAFKIAKGGVVTCALVLLSISGILLMPRAETIGGFNFLMQLPFWCAFIVCMTGGMLFSKRYRRWGT